MYWIFQGNPDVFDVDGYLRDLKKVTWTIRQTNYADQIKVGDCVFFWRAKGSSKMAPGIIAIGTIVSKPILMPDNPESLPYWKRTQNSGDALRVWIEVTHQLISSNYVLSKAKISSDPALENLTILRQPRTTNYKISEDEGNRLFQLFAEDDRTATPEVQVFSWKIEDHNFAWKVLDKSAFLHWGTGIPIAIRPFFIQKDMVPGEKRNVILLHNGKEYSAHVALEAIATARTRLFWNSDFSNLLKSLFPFRYQQYSNNVKPESSIIIKFKRLDGYKKFEISFAGEVSEEVIAKDIEATEIEDTGISKEGALKEYSGKRYERDPKNRAQAIKYHGLTCMVCGFNFEHYYGERGIDFIEVHHKNPIHTFEGIEQHVNPKTDLATLCSNCHRMIHRRADNVLTIEELKTMISSMRSNG